MKKLIRAECQKPGCDRGWLPGNGGDNWKLCPNCNMGIVMVPEQALMRNIWPEVQAKMEPLKANKKPPFSTGGFNFPIWSGPKVVDE